MIKLRQDIYDGVMSLSYVLSVLTSARTHHISEFRAWSQSLHIHTFAMASSSPKNAADEDYQLWDPREKEDTRIGKKFVVRQTQHPF